jgi:HPr kinase/phosphorylase
MTADPDAFWRKARSRAGPGGAGSGEMNAPKQRIAAPIRLHQAGQGTRLKVSQTLHASCVVIGECGILIRGASGAGKSSLAAVLVYQARGRGEFAAWVSDDRVVVTAFGRCLVAAPHPAIAGRIEARGLGILSEPYEPSTVLRLVVDLEEGIERLPAVGELTAVVAGVALRRLPLVAGRAGLYDTSLVFRLMRTRQESESRPTPTSLVGTAGI